MSRVIAEAQLVDLTDQELIDLVGSLWESIKSLEEAMKADTDIQNLQEQLVELKSGRYLDDQKRHKARLKAARTLAKAKGLVFTVPEGY